MLSELYAGMYKEASYSSQALLRIKLGVDNGGILLLGASGEGKSSAGQSLACQYVSKGVSVLALHSRLQRLADAADGGVVLLGDGVLTGVELSGLSGQLLFEPVFQHRSLH